MAKILLVEDDIELSKTLVRWLKSQNYKVEVVESGADALHLLKTYEYDGVIMDWTLPGLTGVEVCRQFRARGGTTPIIMLTGKDAVNEMAMGLDSGADDYLTKPFNTLELAARLRALLRRSKLYVGATLSWQHVSLDCEKRVVTVDGSEIELQPLEFSVLEALMRQPDKVFTSENLISRCWDNQADASADAVYSCIRRLRRKLDKKDSPSIIKTVHGIGYGINT